MSQTRRRNIATALSAAPTLPGAAPGSAPGSSAGSDDGCIRLAAMPLAEGENQLVVDRPNRLIRNVSIMSVGPAMGHGFEIDRRTLETFVEAMAVQTNPKVRYTHPEMNWMDPDGLPRLLGRPENLRIEGEPGAERVRGDIRIAKFAAVSPLGNLAEHVMAIAEEDPSIVGISAVAAFDYEEERDPQTGDVTRRLGRVTWAKAADFVEDPAANRNGLLTAPAPGPRNGDEDGDTSNHTALPGIPGAGGPNMNKRTRAFLVALGKITKDATDEQSKQALQALTGSAKTIAAVLADDKVTEQQLGAKLAPLGVADPAKPEAELLQSNPPANPPADPPADPANAPASGGASGGPAALSQAELDQRIATALQARDQQEQQRVQSLRTLAAQTGLGDAWALQQIESRTTFPAAQTAALAALTAAQGPIPGLHGPRITGGEDGRVAFCAALEDAVMLRAGGELYETNDHGRYVRDENRQLRHREPRDGVFEIEQLTLVEIGRMWLGRLGVAEAMQLSREDVARLCLNRFELAGHIGGRALAHTTSDFPGVFGSVIDKILEPAYEEEESSWEQWAMEELVPTFDQVRFIKVGNVAAPPRVLEGAEYEYATFGEKYEVGQAYKYGLLVALTWEMFINDRINAFTEQAFGFAQSSHALENDLLYALFTGNPTLNEDSTALFHSDHNNLNYGSGAAALDEDTLSDMRTGLRLQRGIAPKAGTNGRRLNLRPNVLLVPAALADAAERLVASVVKVGGTNAEPNLRFIRELQPVVESRLDDDSSTAHYLIAAKKRFAPAANVLHLRGYARPTVERLNTGSSVDGQTWKLRHVAGVVIRDFRPFQKNAGA